MRRGDTTKPPEWCMISEAQDKSYVHVVIIEFDALKEAGWLRRLYTSDGLRLISLLPAAYGSITGEAS